MNKLLTICFLILSFVSFTQSKKKTYEELMIKAEKQTRINDSLETHLLNNLNQLKSQEEYFDKSIKNLIEKRSQVIEEQERYSNTVENYNLLIRTYKPKNEEEIFLMEFNSITNYTPNKPSINYPKKSEKPILKPFEGKVKLIEKNKVLKNYLITSVSYNENVKEEISLIQNEIQKLTLKSDYYETLNSINSEFSNYNKKVIECRSLILRAFFKLIDGKTNFSTIPESLIEEYKLAKREHEFYYKNKYPSFFVTKDDVGDLENSFAVEENTIQIVEPEIKKVSPLIYDDPDEPANFPGGMSAARIFITTNLNYPQNAKENGIEGKCYLKFIVSESGNISNVKVIRGVQDCPECDQEAIRLLKSMPNWEPGKVNGKPVNSIFTLPVPFKL